VPTPTELKTQPISGVAAGAESLLETVYPSVAASPIGRLIGSLMESIPVSIGGVKLSHVLFAPIAIPLGLTGYAIYKLFGDKYEVTNRSVRVRSMIGGALRKQVALTDFTNVAIEVLPGQAFHNAGDLQLLNAKGDTILALPGVVRPDRLQHVLLEARDARMQNDASLKTIQSRATA
jgi:hypothetical protein